jgi:anti-sigma regulatory factor (Ser/Thr protein kinase)
MSLATRSVDEDAYFELSFSPNVKLVSTVRRFVTDFYDELVNSAELISQLAVATHELLENAVRYSLDGNTTIRIGIRRSPQALRVTIDTRNRASVDSIATMRGVIDEIAAAPDPDAHYLVLMRRSAKRVDGSGLGFGRVRAETGMSVSYEVDDDAVHVHAQADFQAAAREATA